MNDVTNVSVTIVREYVFYVFFSKSKNATFTMTLVQSAVLRSHVVCLSVCPSVRPSVCDVGGL